MQKTALLAHFSRKMCGLPHFLALFLESAETPLFLQINVFAVWALRLGRNYTIQEQKTHTHTHTHTHAHTFLKRPFSPQRIKVGKPGKSDLGVKHAFLGGASWSKSTGLLEVPARPN